MSFENSQGNTEMEKPKIESEPFLMGKAIMPDIYPFSSPAFREDTLEKVLVPGKNL